MSRASNVLEIPIGRVTTEAGGKSVSVAPLIGCAAWDTHVAKVYDRPFVRLVYAGGLKDAQIAWQAQRDSDAFVRYVAERGYDRTNLGDIAAELGMSKGTIVHHSGTKAQMLQELEETHLTRQLDVLRMVWDRLAAPHERIAAIIYASALLQVIARNSTVASQREVVQLSDDPAMQQVRKLRHQLQTLAIDEIRNGIRERCVPKRGCRTGGTAAVGIAAVDVGVVRSRRFPDTRTSGGRFRRRVPRRTAARPLGA